ncbi:uncharacterized protein LOC141602330 [Silene latifolia]|uniref:uncharacterized protein LOC141602330 n=1 Tax=Silene latifolia TaxID=37657 RepID=UPI003D76FC20
MVLTINNPINGAKLSATTNTSITHFSLHRSNHCVQPMNPRKACYIVAATGKFNPRTTKFDSKNRRGGTTSSSTTTKEEIKEKNKNYVEDNVNGGVVEDVFADDGFVIPELPGDKPDWFEGPQWDALGFFVQYLWAFGVVFALVACAIAVATYNEGATDFKDTPAYKESIQSQDLLEDPNASDSDIFESNPTEEAPALE